MFKQKNVPEPKMVRKINVVYFIDGDSLSLLDVVEYTRDTHDYVFTLANGKAHIINSYKVHRIVLDTLTEME